jgi:hypothetical protein
LRFPPALPRGCCARTSTSRIIDMSVRLLLTKAFTANANHSHLAAVPPGATADVSASTDAVDLRRERADVTRAARNRRRPPGHPPAAGRDGAGEGRAARRTRVMTLVPSGH